jgi:hypothetical protein
MTTSATITIPAGYLEDARSAALAEITNDSDALRTANPEDRVMSTVILQRSLRLAARAITRDPALLAESPANRRGFPDAP